jgi:glycosyltransferase involved in cell wall biosynthesis
MDIPFVVTVHGNDAYYANQVGGLPGKICEYASLRTFNTAKHVLCISKHVETRVRENPRCRANVTVVYNGVDENLFAPGQEGNNPKIVAVGNLIPTKGHELLLRGFASISSDFPQATLEIIGDGPQRQHLAHLAEQMSIHHQVHFVGRIGRAAVADKMREALFFALPSRDEGLGCVYLEAMAAGKAAVGCRSQGIEEIIQHDVNGWLITPNNLEEMTTAIRILLGDRSRRTRIGVEARKTILQTYTYAHQAEQLAGIYRGALL